MIELNIGDFVEFRNSRWIVINIDEFTCDLMNGYQEQHWNADMKAIKVVAKFR